jgi:hypothetical protein
VKRILHKLTPEKFDVLKDQLEVHAAMYVLYIAIAPHSAEVITWVATAGILDQERLMQIGCWKEITKPLLTTEMACPIPEPPARQSVEEPVKSAL